MAEPKAFLLTFHTYGTWFHGDRRGSVDPEHNQYGTEFLPENPQRAQWERKQLRAPPVVFDTAMRARALEAIQERCAINGWSLLACQVRTNHVHIVLQFAGVAPEEMIRELKCSATRTLRDQGLIARDQPVWAARHGSCKYLWRQGQIDSAVAYVEIGQDDSP